MSKTIELRNGQRFVIVSLPEAAEMIDCDTRELNNWLHAGMINNVECEMCHYTYPLQSDIKALSGYIADFPSSVSLDEIVNQRFDEMRQMKKSRGLFGRTTSKPLPPLRQPEQRPASRPASRQQLPPLRQQRNDYEELEYEQPRSARKNDGQAFERRSRR